MGPLVPDVITDELNLVVGFLAGLAFGFILEQAGFSSSRRLTGLFYGTDFTVLRVFFTAGVTAMSGVVILGAAGLLDTDIIYVNPAYIPSALAGGAVMGVGFVVGGYCPGTGFCGAAIGKVDAMAFVAGAFLGIPLFAEAFPLLRNLYTAGSLGDITVPRVLGIPAGVFTLCMIAGAVGAFMITTRIERRVNPASASHGWKAGLHRLAAAGALGVGLLAALLPDYKTRMMASAAEEPAGTIRRMSPDELAFRILDGDPGLRIVDVREEPRSAFPLLPRAVAIPPAEMFAREWRPVLGRARTRKVMVADREEEALGAALLARRLGYEGVEVLAGGLEAFSREILHPAPPGAAAGRGELDRQRFRMRAGPRLVALIREQGSPRKTEPRTKKITGGCGM
ncbi:MAG: rhodanese-like domain-containing protein [Bacteroidota bacterium]